MTDKTTTKKRKSQREAAKKRQQQIYILVGIIIVAVVAVFAVVLINRQTVAARNTAIAAAEGGTYEGITPTLSEDGLPQLGSADAPVTMHVYSSFGCPHCANFHDDSLPALTDRVRDGDLRIVYVPVTNQFSQPASAAAFCAEERGKFWEMQDVLFGYLRQFSNAAFQIGRLRDAADLLGLDSESFEACLVSDETFDKMNTGNTMFQELASAYPDLVTGTPTITFNGVPTESGSGNLPLNYVEQQITALLAQ